VQVGYPDRGSSVLHHPPVSSDRRAGLVQRSGAGARVLPLSMCASAVAVLLVAVGYAESRGGGGTAVPLFWTGQMLLLAAAAAVLLARHQSRGALTAAVLVYSTAQWLLRVAYAPTRLEFADELQHQRSAIGILQSGNLFPVNHSLPISSVYPGLEAVAVGLTRLTGLDLHQSELVTAGLGHVLGPAALLVLLRTMVPDGRAGALAALFYSLGSYTTFTALFAYQTLAVPVALLVVGQVMQLGGSRDRAHRTGAGPAQIEPDGREVDRCRGRCSGGPPGGMDGDGRSRRAALPRGTAQNAGGQPRR
jgi:hypothetical protein